jgi:predicted RNA-binding Zn-ribbon protein involved in translation (DUF1610 family)
MSLDEDDDIFKDKDPWEDLGLWDDNLVPGIDDDILYIALLLEHYREHPDVPLDDRDPNFNSIVDRVVQNALATKCPDCGSLLVEGTHRGRSEVYCKICGHRHYL